MLTITNIKIYGLKESIKASSYPHKIEEIDYTQEITDKDVERCMKLGKAKSGSGHDCFLKGIIVQCDIKAPQHWWMQAQRYHWFDFVSSQSKMHSIDKINIYGACTNFVDSRIKEIIEFLQKEYKNNPNETNFRILLDSIPLGYCHTARITTNYLQLKTMYHQRKNHRLDEWGVDFFNFCKNLPYFKDFCC